MKWHFFYNFEGLNQEIVDSRVPCLFAAFVCKISKIYKVLVQGQKECCENTE
jgi:hypothetical protein